MKYIRILVLLSIFPVSAMSETSSPQGQVDSFYHEYLGRMSQEINTLDLEMDFSDSLSELFKANEEICKLYADGPCGWGSDGDKYLAGAQEYELGIRYEEYKYTSSEIKPGDIKIKLNVYPSIKNAGQFYEVEMTYRMIYENNKWVVDDVIQCNGETLRHYLEEENEYLAKSAESSP